MDFEKKAVEIGPLRRELCLLPLRHVVRFCRDLKHPRCTARWDGVCIVRIVSLSSCCQEPKSEINKPFVSKTTEFACVLHLHVNMCTCSVQHSAQLYRMSDWALWP